MEKVLDNIEIYSIDTFNIKQFSRNLVDGIHETFATFDIETTTISDIINCKYVGTNAFMYIWQMCIDGKIVIGRRWYEFVNLIEQIKKYFKNKFIIYVHNLSYEFQFMRNFININKVFAVDKRKILKCTSDNIEFRCSWKLSNMSLSKMLENTKNVIHKKQSGDDFNYKIQRFPDTELNDDEIKYCVHDVLGLWEAIKTYLEDDTLKTIPLTSTGFVRRDFREHCLKNPEYRKILQAIRLNEEQYEMCKKCARGAISGSNAIYTDMIIEDVDSYDIKSSYPYQMLTKYYPMSKFIKWNHLPEFEELIELLENKCCMMTVTLKNIRLNIFDSIPFISRHKCHAIIKGKYGNGKVYMAESLTLSCTEIDFKIICDAYNFESCEIHELYTADRGMLPKPFREKLMEYFYQKELLKHGDKYLYNKFKNKINASFGMMLTDIINDIIIYDCEQDNPWTTQKIVNKEKELYAYYQRKTTFLTYQWGVWVLAHARESLYEGMKIVKHNIVQTDTDSIKYVGNYSEEFEKLNNKIIKSMQNLDVLPYVEINNKRIYIGVWEHEENEIDENNNHTYSTFKTLGAKKYCFGDKKGQNIQITVAGLNKKKAANYLNNNGGMDKFEIGTIIPREWSGRTEAFYYDRKIPTWQKIPDKNGNIHTVEIASCIAMIDGEYTFGVTDEWLEMIGIQ